MDHPAPDRFQFGVRHLLMAMLIAATLSAVIAPWGRPLTSGQWLWVGVHVALACGAFAVALWLSVQSRREMTRRIGPLQWRVPIRTWGSIGFRWLHGCVLIAAAALFLIVLTSMAASLSGKQRSQHLEFFQAVYAGWFASIGVLRLRYPADEMLIGACGVYDGRQFIGWENLWCSYEPGALPAALLVKTVGWAHELHVPAEWEPQVAEYLLARAKPWPNPPRRRSRSPSGTSDKRA